MSSEGEHKAAAPEVNPAAAAAQPHPLERQSSDKGLEPDREVDLRKAHARIRYGGLSSQAPASGHSIKKHYFDSADKKVDGVLQSGDGIHKKPAGKTHILLVEDVAISQRVARVALSRARYKVDLATDGETAVEKFKKTAYTVVLMDIHLPKMNGVEATSLIRAFEKETGRYPAVIFALSGSIEPQDMEAYKSVGMNGCIAKGNVLADAVREALTEYDKDPEKFVVRVNLQ